MVLLFGATLTLSAFLLFLVQPMFARMILPLLGGTPAVWNTCVVFFQTALLVGYAYAHASIARLGVRKQTMVHLLVLLLPLAMLPLGAPTAQAPPTETNPSWWVIWALVTTVGAPFIVVASTAPLLQRWFANAAHARSGDPFFLYAASNAGSLGALLTYPTIVERYLPLSAQSRLWTWGYVLLVVAVAACALVTRRASVTDAEVPSERRPLGGVDASGVVADYRRPTLAERLHWLALAAVPSALMLSVTSYISIDIAAVPLLWIVPLSIYLLTFILTFASRPPVPHRLMTLALPIAILTPIASIICEASAPAVPLIALHLTGFFVAAMVCHGELARRRPAPRDLTAFYLWISAGGMLGGMLNTLAAPALFHDALEYPLALIAAAALAPVSARLGEGDRPSARFDAGLALGLGVLVVVLALAVRSMGVEPNSGTALAVVYGIPLVGCALLWPWPRRFALALSAVLIASQFFPSLNWRLLETTRNFFGVNRIALDPRGFNLFIHGRTIHGVQALDASLRDEPLSYFHRGGPAGQALTDFGQRRPNGRVAVLGLGVGTMSAYAVPGQRWTFYEINPAVERTARDARYFTFLRDARAPVDIVMGDARLSLARSPLGAYDAIALDVFSSDAIPMHLLTREALDLYLSKLAPGGLLLFHISNKHLDLRPELGALAAQVGLFGRVRADVDASDEDWNAARFPSTWAALARTSDDIGALAHDARWTALPVDPRVPAWTDEFSNILSVIAASEK